MSAQYFAAQGLTSDDMQGDITLRCLTYVNTKADTALATLAGLPSDVASYATTLSSLVVDMNKLKNYQVVNVKEYGAAGNGSTNDTLAFQIAIGALPINMGCLYIPQGTYLITGSLNIPNRQNLLIKCDNVNIKSNFNGSTFNLNNIIFSQIIGRLKIDAVTSGLSNSIGIDISAFNTLKIEDVEITGDFLVGIKMYNNTNQMEPTILSNCSVYGARTGILLDNGPSAANGAEYVELLGCRCSDCTVVGLQTNAGNTCVTGGYYCNNLIGIKVDGSTGYYNPDHGKLTGVTCNHNLTVGILLRNLKLSFAVVGCQIWATNGPGSYTGATNVTGRIFRYGIYMENVIAANIVGNHIARNRGSVDLGLDGWAECNISNNIFSSDSTAAAIWECGEANSIYGRNQYNLICNNIFQYAITSVSNRISLSNTYNNRSYLINNNIGTTNNNYLMMNTVGATYEIGMHDSYIIDTSIINVAYESSTPNDQSTNIYILPHMFGIPFEINVIGYISQGGFWLRVKTTSTNLPIINSLGSISYYVAHKAIFVSARKIKFTPFGVEGPQWLLSIY
jgi:hypothetical protein